MEAGFRVGFHLDPIIAYPQAERDYFELLALLFDTIAPEKISFVSMGGLRMTPALRKAARARFPTDPMLVGEEVLSSDGRYRTFAALRTNLYRSIEKRLKERAPGLPRYLCMESASVSERVFGVRPQHPAALGDRLATR